MKRQPWIVLTASSLALTGVFAARRMATAASDETVFIKPADIKADKQAPGMRVRQLGDDSWALIFSSGDEIFSGLTSWAAAQHIKSAHLTALGAWKSATLGYYDLKHRAYRKIAINEQVELLSLVGDFANDNGKPVLHAHVVVGRPDGSTRGGHLIEAYASPTTEVFVTTSPVELHKMFDPASGLDLITIRE